MAAGLHDPFEPLEGIDPLSMRVLEAFMRAVAAHRQLMFHVFAQEGAHPGQAFCLKILARRDGISQRELAGALHLSAPTVTAMLQRMERAGTIERRPDATDGRVTRVHLTQLGRERELELRRVIGGAVGGVLAGIPEADRRELERLLGMVADRAASALE
jgi:DNA-binding MarR family transcriptional regulator